MKTTTLYQCEICEQWYSDEAKARACEAQGQPTRYPPGLIWAARPVVVRRSSYYGLVAVKYLGHEAKITLVELLPRNQSDWEKYEFSLTKRGAWLGEDDALRDWQNDATALALVAAELTAYGHPLTHWNGREALPYPKETT